MKTVILDFKTVTNNDVNSDVFRQFGEVSCYDMTSADEIISRIGDAEAVLCNKSPLQEQVLRACTNLKYIGLFATGYNNIDMKTANELGITVCNAGEYSTMAVAQHVFALILQFYSHVSEFNESVQNGDWIKSETFSYFLPSVSSSELMGKTIGIIGFGSIGKAVAKIADAFGMNVIVSTRTEPKEGLYNYRFVTRAELFASSDIITLHCPLNEDTYGMINSESLSLMKKTALLINTSRGGTVIESDLAAALNSGKIAGAALDVVSIEPMRENNPLCTAENCIITPHVAWAPVETRERLITVAAENLKCFIAGEPQNVVN